MSVDIFVGWSVTIGIGLALATLTLKETLMNHLDAIVLIGASLLPVPGGIPLHSHKDGRKSGSGSLSNEKSGGFDSLHRL